MARINLLGASIDNVSMKEALDYIDNFVDSGTPHQIAALNAAKVVKMSRDIKLCNLVNTCDLIFADGQSLVWASKLLGCPLKVRVAGIDLMQEAVKYAVRKKYKLYLLGAKEDVVEKVVDTYRKRFPGINILGWHSGYFKSGDEEKAVIGEIRHLKPDILFVAMDSPRKEYWIRENLGYLGVPVCMGVGGSFDVIAGLVKRAPRWMQKMGLEWFFRFLSEPGRLWKRYLLGNVVFIWMVLKQMLGVSKACRVKVSIKKIITSCLLIAFPFYIPWDYCSGSRLDMSFLLDGPAGRHGFVTVREGHFYFEDGKRARFWGVNIHSDKACYPTHSQAEQIAKRLAQLGCNIVRMHLLDNESPHGLIDSQYDDSQHLSIMQLERLDYFIYQLKKNGIYVTFDVLGVSARKFKAGDGVAEYDKIRRRAGLGIAFFDKRIIELSKKFARDFLTHVNPYTGIAYIDEPAISMVEMMNENTFINNWKTDSFPPYYAEEIKEIWKAWKEKKGLSQKDRYKNWNEDREFLFELQDGYQKEMYSYLRSIGVKCPIGASNYCHDNLVLAADSNMDFTDTHPYWDHPSISERLHNRPLIKQSHLNPETIVNTISRAKAYNKPLILTEWDSIWPNEWRALDVLTTASYAALNDLDALFLYAYNGGWQLSWENLENKIYYPTVVFNDPAKMGLFPIGALIFLRGDVSPALNTYYASYDIKSLFEKSESNLDRLKLAGIMYVSKLEKKIYRSSGGVHFNEASYPEAASRMINNGNVISDTGEIERDSEKGVFILKSPRTFSFSGFVGGEDGYEFSGIRFYTESDFATFTITSLDSKAISNSGHLLLSVIGRVYNKDQRLSSHSAKRWDDLRRDVYISNRGDVPILAESIDGKVYFEKNRINPRIEVYALGQRGTRAAKVSLKEKDDYYYFSTPTAYKTIYYEILRY